MKKNNGFATILGIIAVIVAIVTIFVVFRKEIEDFISGVREKLGAAKEDMFTPDEYSDFADIE